MKIWNLSDQDLEVYVSALSIIKEENKDSFFKEVIEREDKKSKSIIVPAHCNMIISDVNNIIEIELDRQRKLDYSEQPEIVSRVFFDIKLDVSDCIALRKLDCSWTGIEELNISNCINLVNLDCSMTGLEVLDLSNCTKLEKLNCEAPFLKKIDVSKCTKLKVFYCSYTDINKLNLLRCSKLIKLNCISIDVEEIDISNCIKLEHLICKKTNIKKLDISACPNLKYLNCSRTHISNLDASDCENLETLNCSESDIEELNVSNCSQLLNLNCSNTSLRNLDISKCFITEKFSTPYPARISHHLNCSCTYIKELNLFECKELNFLDCSKTKLEIVDVSSCSKLKEIDVSDCINLKNLLCNTDDVLINTSGCTEYLNNQENEIYMDEDWDNSNVTYDEYRGSYAQEEMGYSDQDIDDAFDGDPDAYWNID